jgi:RNA polymerase sigma factor (sigma-70 family)
LHLSQAPENINKLADHLFRHEAGRMVSILTRIFGLHNLELAEDVVQEAFAKALKDWIYQIPANPSGWLMQTAKNKAIDTIRRRKYQKEFSSEFSFLLKSGYTSETTVHRLFLDHEIEDSQLRMIFACCHPGLSEADQVALTLKICSGFSINEIANALLAENEAIKKRIQRATHYIKENNLQFEIPTGKTLEQRLDIVLKVLYLLFNEGYNSSQKDKLIRKDLCVEAMRLTLLLTNNSYVSQPKCFALVALMSLLVSRFDARLDENNEIILLEHQDRSKWNQELIAKGLQYLDRAAVGNELSEFHIEAAIVVEHSVAKQFADTSWSRILELYDMLMKMNNSFIVQLNRAIVISRLQGPAQGIKEIKAIPGIEKIIETHYLTVATLGDLYLQLKQNPEARFYLSKAIELTRSDIEKKLLHKKLKMTEASS